MTDKVAVGVVGCGYWGPNLVRNLADLPNARVAAICDLDPDRLEQVASRYPQAKRFAEFERMLGSGIDAVAIATPVHSHYTLARAALLAGKHVLIEKPMASSSGECEELIRIAAERDLTLMVGHTFLYSEAVLRIAEIISRGDIGELRYINSQRLNFGLFQQDVNVAWDLAAHDLSIILHLIGKAPETANCQGYAHLGSGVEDVTNISLGFADNHFATIQSSWLEPRKVRLMTIVGTERMIVFDDLEPREKLRIYDVRVERPPHYETFADFHCSYHYGDCHIPHLDQQEPLRVMCQHFVDCIVKRARPLTSGEQGVEVVRVLEACSASLAAGGAAVPVAGSANERVSREVSRSPLGRRAQ